MKRSDFLKASAAGLVGLSALPFVRRGVLRAQESGARPEVVWVQNGEPAGLVQAAITQFGGMEQFISRGDDVVIKPNIGWDRAPQYAANTNPDLVAEVVRLCLNAGARRVKVLDHTINNPQRCYHNSEIEKKAAAAGAQVIHVREHRFKEIKIQGGEVLDRWPVYTDYLAADKTINIAIAKHHSLCRVTLGLKNLMGIMGGNRGEIHNGFTTKLADITSQILPTLTIIDGYRILTANGPSGGNLADVKTPRTLIMSPCTVTADYVALSLFDLTLDDVGYLKEMVRRGHQQYDLNNLQVKKVSLP